MSKLYNSNNKIVDKIDTSAISKINLKTKIEEARAAEEAKNYFNAAILYKDALEFADKLQDSESIKLCKQKMVEMNKKSIESGKDFNEVEFSHELSAEQQESLKTFIVGILKIKDKNRVLKIIGQHPELMPKVKEIEIQARETIPLTRQIATLTTISNEGHNLRGGTLGEYSWFMEMYGLRLNVIMTLCLSRLMYMLTNSNPYQETMTVSDMSNYFTNSHLINPKRLKIILVGLSKYFDKDYISSLHILIPQFEAFFLDIAQKMGINIVALDKIKKEISTRTITLSEIHLDSDVFKTIFGVDFCQQVRFILFEPMGYKLRHKIAHGEIESIECNFQNATLVIYLYLVLLSKFKTKLQTE